MGRSNQAYKRQQNWSDSWLANYFAQLFRHRSRNLEFVSRRKMQSETAQRWRTSQHRPEQMDEPRFEPVSSLVVVLLPNSQCCLGQDARIGEYTQLSIIIQNNMVTIWIPDKSGTNGPDVSGCQVVFWKRNRMSVLWSKMSGFYGPPNHVIRPFETPQKCLKSQMFSIQMVTE